MNEMLEAARPPVRHCEARLSDGTKCPSYTRERKPYCTDHVELLDRVKWIETELAVREQEVKRLARSSQPVAPKNSRLLKDVLAILMDDGPVVSIERVTLLLDAELSPLEDDEIRRSRRATKVGSSEKPSEVDTWESVKKLKAKVTHAYMRAIVDMGLAHWKVTKRGVSLLVMNGHEVTDRAVREDEAA